MKILKYTDILQPAEKTFGLCGLVHEYNYCMDIRPTSVAKPHENKSFMSENEVNDYQFLTYDQLVKEYNYSIVNTLYNTVIFLDQASQEITNGN